MDIGEIVREVEVLPAEPVTVEPVERPEREPVREPFEPLVPAA